MQGTAGSNSKDTSLRLRWRFKGESLVFPKDWKRSTAQCCHSQAGRLIAADDRRHQIGGQEGRPKVESDELFGNFGGCGDLGDGASVLDFTPPCMTAGDKAEERSVDRGV